MRNAVGSADEVRRFAPLPRTVYLVSMIFGFLGNFWIDIDKNPHTKIKVFKTENNYLGEFLD